MKTTIADTIRLGSDVAAVKQGVSRQKWRKIVRTAHKEGYTVSGALSDVPSALKERTRKSLVQEATKTVQQAYKPQETELNRQQLRQNAIADKRRADDGHYREWIATQTDKMFADARAADTALNGLSQTTAAAAKAGWQEAKDQALASVGNTPGNVSDPSQSTALNAGIDNAAAGSTAAVGAAAANSATTVGSHTGNEAFLRGAILANAAGNRAKIEGETSQSQEKLNEAAAALKSAKTGDLSKSITNLLSGEASKANANRDYAAAAQKLGVEKQKIDLASLVEKHSYSIKKKTINLEQYKADNAKAFNDAKIKVDYDKIASSEGKDAADRALRKYIADNKNATDLATSKGKGGKGGKNGPTAAQIKESRTGYKSVENVRADLVELHKKYGNSNKDKKGNSFRTHLAAKGYDNVMIDIAEDLRKHDGKLSPAGMRKAKSVGVARFYQPYKPGTGTASQGHGGAAG